MTYPKKKHLHLAYILWRHPNNISKKSFQNLLNQNLSVFFFQCPWSPNVGPAARGHHRRPPMASRVPWGGEARWVAPAGAKLGSTGWDGGFDHHYMSDMNMMDVYKWVLYLIWIVDDLGDLDDFSIQLGRRTPSETTNQSIDRDLTRLPCLSWSVSYFSAGLSTAELLTPGFVSEVVGRWYLTAIFTGFIIPRSSMVLVYLPTKLGHLWGFYVGKYTIHGWSGYDKPYIWFGGWTI